MRHPPLSVLLPCRDAAAHLPQAIHSLRLQTFSEFEVVAVDDGSVDDTRTILERWAGKDARVRIVELGGVGVAEALRVGTAECRGELLARADADDVSHPRRLAEQVRCLSDRRELTAVGTRVRYFPWSQVGWGARRYQNWLNSLSEPAAIERDIFVECPIAHPTLMVRRSALEEVGGYRVNGWPEDYDLILRLHEARARMANLPRVLHFWREGGERLSRIDPRYSPDAFRECKVHYLRQGPLKDLRAVTIWGAGRVGKAFARALQRIGVEVRRFLDIDPRKIGQQVHGAPVADAREMVRGSESYTLVAVGSPGARALIRAELGDRGLREIRDYRCVA